MITSSDRMARSGEDQFGVALRYDDSTFVIEFFGELDLSTADTAREAFATAIASPAEMIVADLSGLHFVDSSGVEVLLGAISSESANGARIRFLRGAGQVERVLALCGLEGRLPYLD